MLVDGHLDLAFNWACFGRDPRQSAFAVREREGAAANEAWRGKCMVGIPEMRKARVGLIFPTIFLAPRRYEFGSGDPSVVVYETAEEAHRFGQLQLDRYHELAADPDANVRLVGSRADLEEVVAAWESADVDPASAPIGMVPLMEGADPIRTPEELPEWYARGLRIVGLAWRSTRYSAGTSEPGPLTPAGRALVPAIHAAGMTLDLSHAAEEAFFESLDLTDGPVIASHSNPRFVCDTDRQLSDDMLRAIAQRDGVIGSVPFNLMLVDHWQKNGKPAVPLARVAEAISHVAEVTGRHDVLAIGSDFDGGFGADAAPDGLDTIADLPRLGEVLADRGFTDDQIWDILGRNWVRFLRRVLPEG